MPRSDGTGPDGRGPRTGRGLGSCNSANDAFPPQGQKPTGSGLGSGRKNGSRRGPGSGRGAGQGSGRFSGQGPGRGSGKAGRNR